MCAVWYSCRYCTVWSRDKLQLYRTRTDRYRTSRAYRTCPRTRETLLRSKQSSQCLISCLGRGARLLLVPTHASQCVPSLLPPPAPSFRPPPTRVVAEAPRPRRRRREGPRRPFSDATAGPKEEAFGAHIIMRADGAMRGRRAPALLLAERGVGVWRNARAASAPSIRRRGVGLPPLPHSPCTSPPMRTPCLTRTSPLAFPCLSSRRLCVCVCRDRRGSAGLKKAP